MLKISLWLPFFFLGILWPAASTLADEDFSEDISSALSAPSGTSEETSEAVSLNAKTLQEMLPQAMALARQSSKGTTPQDAALREMIPQVVAAAEAMSKGTMSKDAALKEILPHAAALAQMTPKKATSEEARPEIDSAVQMAQDEVRDPFAAMIEPEAPKEEEVQAVTGGPVQPVGPPVVVELQGIGFGSEDAYAIIGGEVYHMGDEKNGIKLLEVRRREVDIQANGGKMTVPLFPGGELQRAKDRAEKKGLVKDAKLDQKPEIPGSLSQGEQTPL